MILAQLVIGILLAILLAFLLLLAGKTIAYMIPMLNGPVFVPSADDKLRSMLDLAQAKKGDKIIDLGAGDGKVVIALAKQGIAAKGAEINPLLVKKAQDKIEKLGLEKLAQVEKENMWDLDLGKYDLIFVYGTTYIMPRLETKLLQQAKPGVRVVSNYFQFPHLKPVKQQNEVRLYLPKPTLFAVNKPKGPSSHDLINQIRKITGVRKVGHAGTLDPLAQGVLVVAVTRAGTKQLKKIVKQEKEYLAHLKLGEVTETLDSEVKPRAFKSQSGKPVKPPAKEQIKQVLLKLTGWQWQTPPKHSAALIKGKRAYHKARQGDEFEVPPTRVEIKQIELLEYDWPYLKIKVVTGAGAYIRSLARDIGINLDTGAYLTKLVRTRVGQFKLEDCLSLEQLSDLWPDGSV